MAFRFQRRLKILPGVSLNLSKSGVSTSFGVRGARVTVGHGKTRTTLGIPGTGISYTSVTNQATDGHVNSAEAPPSTLTMGWLFLLGLTLLAWFLWLSD